MISNFLENEEEKIVRDFYQNGYVVVPVSDLELLSEVKKQLFQWAKEIHSLPENLDFSELFNNTQKYISPSDLNDFRVKAISKLTGWTDLRPTLYHLGKKYINWIVGNELAMQRSINLSIQLPNDKSSLLPLHTDVWSGNSPYEIVFWLPFVDCFKTKSMYILPYTESQRVTNEFKNYSHLNAEELYQAVKSSCIELDVPFGHAAIFSHSLLHGNRINLEDKTRWTFNVRFKSLLSPYGSKEVGETFLPINIRPITQIGFHYKKPSV